MSNQRKDSHKGTFQNDVIYLLGSFDSTLISMDKRLNNIEGKIGQVCPAHESIVKMFNGQKNINIDHKARNDARTIEQTAQDVKIRDLEETDRVITAKLSPEDRAKIDLTQKAALGSIVLWLITYALKYLLGINL